MDEGISPCGTVARLAGPFRPGARSSGGPRRPIERPELLRRLAACSGQPILTVIAPTGYGKTASIALWDDADPRPFAWVRLDQLDDNPSHLARHLATSLDAVAPVDARETQALGGIGRSIGEDLLPCLARLLAGRAPCVVVLDDVHHLRSVESLTLLDGLLDVIPSGSQIVLIGRSVSELPLTRRRLDDLVGSVTTGDLIMTDEDATRLVRSMETRCSDAEVQAIVARGEGWPAGLQLMALGMHDDGSNPGRAHRARPLRLRLLRRGGSRHPPRRGRPVPRTVVRARCPHRPLARRAARDRGQRHDPEVPRRTRQRLPVRRSTTSVSTTGTTASSPRCSPTASR